MKNINKSTSESNAQESEQRVSATQVEADQQKYRLSDKCLALLAFIDTGLIQEGPDGYNIAEFNAFWDKYEERKHRCQLKIQEDAYHLQRRIENASLAIALLCLIAALIMLAIVIS